MSMIFGMNIPIAHQGGVCVTVVELLKANNASIAGFDDPGISLKLETRRPPFTLELLGCDRDGRVPICRAHIEDELCNRLHISPLSGTQLEAWGKERFIRFRLRVHNIFSILLQPLL